MSFKVEYAVTTKVPNPPAIEDYASAYVPSAEEIAGAPGLLTRSVLEMFIQGRTEFDQNYRMGAVQATPTGEYSFEQMWISEEKYNEATQLERNFPNANVSEEIKVYLRVKQQYNNEYFNLPTVTTSTI